MSGKREGRSWLRGFGSGLDTEQEEASPEDVLWLVQDRAGGAVGAALDWAPWAFGANAQVPGSD